MKKFIQKKLMSKAYKKIQKHMPDLKSFAVENDDGYNALVKVMEEINSRRKKSRKYTITID